MDVSPIQSAPQTVVAEHIGGNPFSQQVLNWLVRKIVGHEVQLSMTESEPIEDHRDRGLADTHAAAVCSGLFIQPLR
jgi:hypothetical protein